MRRWPNLRVQGVTELEWLALAAVLERDLFADELASTESDEGEHGAIVRPMTDEAAAHLARLPAPERSALCSAWRDAADGLSKVKVADVAATLDKLCAFADEAGKKHLPILYFDTW